MQTLIGEDEIQSNEQLFGDVSEEDAALINADLNLSPEQKAAALMDPETYKFHLKNPYIARDAENYPALFESLRNPSMFQLYRANQQELIDYEDQLKGLNATVSNGFKNYWRELRLSWETMDLNKLKAKRAQAIHDNDNEAIARLDKEIADQQLSIDRMDRPSRQAPFALGSLSASIGREILPLTASSLATGLLSMTPGGQAGAAVTGAKTIAALKNIWGAYRASKAGTAIAKVAPYMRHFINAGIIYNDTKQVEMGAAYDDLAKKYPNMSEEERFSKADMIGTINGGLESLTAFAGAGYIVGKTATGITRKTLLKNTLTKTLTKNVISADEKVIVKKAVSNLVENGVITPEMINNPSVLSKIVSKIRDIAETRTARVARFELDAAAEGATEVYQDEITNLITSLKEGQSIGYDEALSSANTTLSNQIMEVFNYVVNGEPLSEGAEKNLDTLISVFIGTNIIGGAFRSADYGVAKMMGEEARSAGNQIDNAKKNINRFDNVLAQKKNSKLNQKSPEAMNAFYGQAVAKGELPQNVYVEADALKAVLEKMKNDPIAMAKVGALKLQEKAEQAAQTDGMVEIPTEEFIRVVVDPNNDALYQAIKNDMTDNPAMNSLNGAIDLVEKMTNVDKMMREAVKSNDSIYNYVLNTQIANGADKDVAKAEAVITQALFNTFGRMRNDGVNLRQIQNKIGLQIQMGQNIQPTENGFNLFVTNTTTNAGLDIARKMRLEGKSDAEILKATGWSFDKAYGEWFTEISDKDYKINMEVLNDLLSKNTKQYKLSDLVSHDKLFNLFPSLKNLPVESVDRITNNYKAAAVIETNEITGLSNPLEILINRNKAEMDQMREILIHEIQHTAQAINNLPNKRATGSNTIPESYNRMADEHEIISTQLLENAKKKTNKIKYAPTTTSVVWAVPDVRKILDEIAKTDESTKKLLERWDEINKVMAPVYKKMKFDKYLRLPEENQARDTSTRLNLTDEQRREILPANVTGERAPVVTFNDGTRVPLTQPEAPSGIVAQIQFGAQTIIKLSNIKDPVEFAHEVFHLFGHELFSAFNSGALNERWTKHAETLAEFLGLKKDKDGKYDFDNNVQANETLAGAGTTYLKTGKSPAPYLKELFDMFAEWFAEIFRLLKLADVPLDRKVRKVFDEIFVPYEIQRSILLERRYGFVPKPEGMTDEAYERYVAEKRAAAFRGTTEEVKKAAKLQEVMSERAYQEARAEAYRKAYDQLGEMPVYQLIEDVLTYKINRGSLKKLAKSVVIPRKYLSTKEGYDIMQFLAQYTSVANNVDELANILLETPDRESAANYAADQEMKQWLAENYPDLAEIDAGIAARNERVFRLGVMEYMMLAGIPMERFNQIHNDLLAVAENMVQNMPINKMANYIRWVEQEAKLMQRYDYTKKPADKAQIKKQQAILNYYAMRSKNLYVDVTKFIKHTRVYRGPQTKQVLKEIDGETFDLLKALLGQFGFTKAQPNTSMPISVRLRRWVASMAAQQYTGAEEVMKYIDRLVAGVEGKVTTSDFEFLSEVFSFIEAVGKKQKMVNLEGEQVLVETSAQQVAQEYANKGVKPLEKPLGSAVMREPVMRELFPVGVFLNYIAPIFEGITKRDYKRAEWRQKAAEIIKPLFKHMQDKVEIDGHVFTNENLLVMMLNSGNRHNINCCVRTLQFQLNDPEFGVDEFFSVLNQAPVEMREMARQIWKIFDDNKKEFQDVQKKIDGKVLKFVEAEPYKFADGEEMPGGYYPAGKLAVANNYEDAASTFKNNDLYATNSFQKEREGYHGDLDLTLGSLYSWFNKMSGTLFLAVPYNNLGKLMKNETFRRTVGDGMIKSMEQWRNLIVTPDKVNQVLSAVNQVASVSILGFDMVRMFTQMSGIIPAMAEVGPYWIMNGISGTNPILTVNQAKGLSLYMRERYEHPEDHLHLYTKMKSLFADHLSAESKGVADRVAEAGMFFVVHGDAIASIATWKAQFAKSKAEGLTDKQASAMADSMVRTIQGDASAGSRPPIIQGNMRFFTMFASYFIGIHSLLVAHKISGNKTKAAMLILAAALAAPMFEAVFTTAWELSTEDDKEKKKREKRGIEDEVDFYIEQATGNVLSSAGAMWIPHFGIGSSLGTALFSGKVYKSRNVQLEYMMKPIEVVAGLRNAFFAKSEKESKKYLKNSLQSGTEFGMLGSLAKQIVGLIIGD